MREFERLLEIATAAEEKSRRSFAPGHWCKPKEEKAAALIRQLRECPEEPVLVESLVEESWRAGAITVRTKDGTSHTMKFDDFRVCFHFEPPTRYEHIMAEGDP